VKSIGIHVLGASLALAACGRASEENGVANAAAAAIPSPASAPDARTPLAEPRGTIDPKSAEAAGQVVQSYGALIEQRRWTDAEALWSDPAKATEAKLELDRLSEVHLEIGEPGNLEGAAGSIYVAMPVAFYGKLEEGEPYRRGASIILRRANDVPGSTEKQRRWHIERIEWAASG